MGNKKKALYQRLDAPLSSVLINCLQLPCGVPLREDYCDYESQIDTANWMSQLMMAHGSSISLRDLVLPGCHDAASATIKCKPFAVAGRTQSVGVGQQLEMGARYLDLRVATGKSHNMFSIWHGCLEGGDLQDVLLEISDFAHNHANELIVVELVAEHGRPFEDEDKQKCLQAVKDILGESIFPGSDLPEIITTPIAQVVKNRKERILLLVHDRFSIPHDFGNSKQLFRNPWHNTRDIDTIFSKNLTAVQGYQSSRTTLVSNQFVATPGVSGGKDVLGLILGTNPLRVVSHACNIHNRLLSFLRQHADEKWNIVTLDFLELGPEVVDALISFNYCHESTSLDVKYAVLNGKDDVTDKLNKDCLCRSNSVLIVDEDYFGKAPVDDLTIAYTINGIHYVASFQCDPVVLSAAVKTAVQVTGDAGYVAGGHLYETKEKVPNDAVALEYSMEENGQYTFKLA